MRIRKLLWSQSVIKKLHTKHKIQPPEVREICAGNHLALRGRRGTHYLLGQTAAGRYLFVVLSNRGKGKFKVVTAREMNAKEKRLFRRRKGQ